MRAKDIQQPAQRRAGDRCGLAGRGRPGNRLRHLPVFNQAGENGLHGGKLKCARRADGGNGEEDSSRMQAVQVTARGQQRNRCTIHKLANDEDFFAIHMVRNVAHDQRQQQHGQELHQAHHAQCKGAVGEGIHLPADSHGHHLKRHHGADANKPEPRVGGLMKDRLLTASFFGELHEFMICGVMSGCSVW